MNTQGYELLIRGAQNGFQVTFSPPARLTPQGMTKEAQEWVFPTWETTLVFLKDLMPKERPLVTE